ncbi:MULTISPECIES: TetR/AcrR family transcriptional regulator [unclassified Lonepinella]|uniref:TetR/AcrR family transcriptional regulator n=1 Tax=unclassified Lonepinella TaxID=2642006 RepID=UPI003F6DD7F6
MQNSELDMVEQIFAATERLMADQGLPNLSMHKIAKEAKISAGTIYIYFKSKEELLEQFARKVFSTFRSELEKNVDNSLSFFAQYRQMWKNIWHHLLENPMVVANLHQYKSLPRFHEICQEMESQSCWASFCAKAQQANVLCDLPADILFSLGLESAVKLAYRAQEFRAKPLPSNAMLDIIIERTWRSIQKEI